MQNNKIVFLNKRYIFGISLASRIRLTLFNLLNYMGIFNYFNVSDKKREGDTIRINFSQRKVNGTMSGFKFKDKDTQQYVIFIPAFDVTGYGETEKKAYEMLKSSMNFYIDDLMKKSVKQIQQELSQLGWKHNPLRNKEYSKAYVDVSGELKNFNAVDNKIERITLEAA